MTRKLDGYLSLEEIGGQIQAMEDEFTYKQLQKEYEKAKEGFSHYETALNNLKLAINHKDKAAVLKRSADLTRHADSAWIRCLRIKALSKYLSD